jgi:hypothetical protein
MHCWFQDDPITDYLLIISLQDLQRQKKNSRLRFEIRLLSQTSFRRLALRLKCLPRQWIFSIGCPQCRRGQRFVCFITLVLLKT